MKNERNDQEIATSFWHSPSPPYIVPTVPSLPRFASGTNPWPTFPSSLALMADPHQLSPGNPAFGMMSALSSPLPSRSGTPSIDYPLAFMADQLAQRRDTRRLNPQDHPDFSGETVSGTIPSELTVITRLA